MSLTIPEIVEQIGIKPYHQEDAGVIYCADCRDILPLIPKVDLVLTDPPYKIAAKGCGLAGNRKYLKKITSDNIDTGFDISILSMYENWFCFCGLQQLLELLQVANGNNFMLITWNKSNPTPLTNNNYLPDCEYIVHKYAPNRLFGTYKDKSRFINLSVEKNEFSHPTVKPLPVIRKLLNLGSEKNNIILDPFLGSGTTAVAAKELGRKFIGIEISEEYCAIAKKRLRQNVLF